MGSNTRRKLEAIAAANAATTVLYPAILGTGSTNKYAETTVFTILGEAAQLIIHLKNNATTNGDGILITDAITLG